MKEIALYVGEICLNAIKDWLKNIFDEYALKKKIEEYASHKLESVFAHASLDEEIDYGGLSEFLKNNFLDEVRKCLFRRDYTSQVYYNSILTKAIAYAHVDNIQKKASVEKFINSVIEITRDFILIK
jgi:hypothetical protein